MNYIFFGSILAVGAIVGAYTTAFQSATLYWGRHLSGLPSNEEIIRQKVAAGMSEPEARGFVLGYSTANRGAQDAITSKLQTFRNLLFFAVVAFALIGGWIMFKWYVGAGAFFGLFMATGMLKCLLPKPESEFFRKRITG